MESDTDDDNSLNILRAVPRDAHHVLGALQRRLFANRCEKRSWEINQSSVSRPLNHSTVSDHRDKSGFLFWKILHFQAQ